MLRIPSTIHEVPFVRLLIPLLIGILLQHYLNLFNPFHAILILVLLFLLLAVTHIFLKSWGTRWLFGAVLSLLLVLAGCLLVALNSPNANLKTETSQNMIVRLAEPPSIGSNTIKAKAEIMEIRNGSVTLPTSVLLYFALSDSNSYGLKYGDIIALNAKLKEFSPPPNPYQFNLKRYMYLFGVVYHASVSEGHWEKIGNRTNFLYGKAFSIQRYVIKKFEGYGIKGQELGVISALMLGYKSLLDDEIRRIYSSVGAMHILAVSGLHVGLIFALALMIIAPIPKRKIWLSIRLFAALTVLWGYAFITGLSPSVCRATFMFSLFAVGQTAGLKANSFNTISAAAFILLVTNPFMLFNVGFQLSFAAVLSIVIFQPFIYNLVTPNTKILDYVWSLIAVSAAAQVLTLPISLLNFGQFPLLFLLTNLVAIPLATIILYLSVATIILSVIPPLGYFAAKLLGFATLTLNSGLKLIDTFPYSSIDSIHFTSWQSILLALSILFFALFLVTRKTGHMQLAILSYIGVLILWATNIIKVKNSSELVVFSLPKSSAICINSRGKPTIFVYDSVNSEYSTAGYIRHCSLERPTVINLNSPYIHVNPQQVKVIRKSGLATIITGNTTIALAYSDSVKNIKTNIKLNVDLVIENRYSCNKVFEILIPKRVIIDPSVSGTEANKLMAKLLKGNIAFHNMYRSGYYKCNLF